MVLPHPGRARRLVGWGAFLLAVLVLKLVGLGDSPPAVGAASVARPAAHPATEQATRALDWIVAGFDRTPYAEATDRCLAAGPACTVDDALATDSTRVQLASLADALRGATDPADPGYLGELDPAAGRRAAATQQAASTAADALVAFLSGGCAGSVDGMPVAQVPSDCDRVVAPAQQALAAVDRALSTWRAAPR